MFLKYSLVGGTYSRCIVLLIAFTSYFSNLSLEDFSVNLMLRCFVENFEHPIRLLKISVV